jgi:hypothetical protein
MSNLILLLGAGLIAIAFVIVQLGLIRVNRKLDIVHVLVNSKMTAALEKIEKLEALTTAQQKQLDTSS